MRKEGLIILVSLSILLVTAFVIAQESGDDNQVKINLAYQCIESRVGTDCSTLTQSDQAFSLLALGDVEDCKDSLISNSDNEGECWPSGNCNLKDTAISIIALNHIGEDTSKARTWLSNQKKVADSLIWYIEIDADKKTTCDISHDTATNSITINEDKTISGLSDACFSLSQGNYWLQVNNNCLEKEFTISCEEDFKSTILYQTQSSSTIHVSQNLHSSSAGSFTTEKVTFECFQEGTACNFEGSLWSSLALRKNGQSVDPYLPYLRAFAPENAGSFPEAFLYILTGDQDYLSSTINDNFKGNYWQVGTKNREYNTALAFMALGENAIPQVEKAKMFFLNNQENNGCWNNVRDTGFLLYAGWPREPVGGTTGSSTTGGSIGGTTGEIIRDCEENNFYCIPSFDCPTGSNLPNYYCANSLDACCSKPQQIGTCSEQFGIICDLDEKCSNGEYIDSIDVGINCCATTCEKIPIGTTDEETQTTDACTDAGGTCKVSCSSNEQEDFSLSCGEFSGSVCCFDKSANLFWIWFFLVAIVAVIILILLRNKIRLLFFRVKSKFKKSPPKSIRPTLFPPSSGTPPQALRPTSRLRPKPPIRKSATNAKDKEFEDTLRKLREMSK